MKITKRNFLQATGAGSLFLAFPTLNLMADDAYSSRSGTAFVESHDKVSMAFAERLMKHHGAIIPEIINVSSAVSQLHDIDPHKTTALFGLTNNSTFTIVSQLAREKNYRLVYRGEHISHINKVVHKIRGKSALLRKIERALRQSDDWSSLLGSSLANMPDEFGEMDYGSWSFNKGNALEETQNWYSWVFETRADYLL